MELGMIGLGRMDDIQPQAAAALAKEGAVRSRGEANFADKILSPLRYEFGGHQEKAAVPKGGA